MFILDQLTVFFVMFSKTSLTRQRCPAIQISRCNIAVSLSLPRPPKKSEPSVDRSTGECAMTSAIVGSTNGHISTGR